MGRSLSSVVCGVVIAVFGSSAGIRAQPTAIPADAAITSAAEVEYRELVALEKARPPNHAGMTAAEYSAWSMARNGELHERGLVFLEKYPAHPLRWEVLLLMRYAVNFTREEVSPSGERTTVPDHERMSAWQRRHRSLLDQLLEAPDASPKVILETLRHLITVESMNIASRHRGERSTEERMAHVLQWLERFEMESPDKWPLSTLYLNVARAIDRIDAVRCLAFITEKRANHLSGDRTDASIREALDGRLRTLLAAAEPLWVRLRALDGRFADTQMYRGKVVLIAIFPVTWKENAAFLEKLYHQHHAEGLEVIQVTSGENREELGRPLEPLEVAIKVEDKQWPWPVVWDRQGLMGQFARALGIRSQPTWLLLARDGRLVAERDLRSQVAAEIKRELSLNPQGQN